MIELFIELELNEKDEKLLLNEIIRIINYFFFSSNHQTPSTDMMILSLSTKESIN